MADATVRGRFVWHDLMTPNSAGAHEFYGKALDWKTEAWEQDRAYLMFAGPNGPIGGTVETRATTPHWLPYIGTMDVDATVEAATRLGASVQTPTTALPNGGRFAALIDPQGAPFGIHASSAATAPEAPPQPGEFSWHELVDERRSEHRVRVLRRVVRLGRDQPARHGPDGHVPRSSAATASSSAACSTKAAPANPATPIGSATSASRISRPPSSAPRARAARCSPARWTCPAAIASRN